MCELHSLRFFLQRRHTSKMTSNKLLSGSGYLYFSSDNCNSCNSGNTIPNSLPSCQRGFTRPSSTSTTGEADEAFASPLQNHVTRKIKEKKGPFGPLLINYTLNARRPYRPCILRETRGRGRSRGTSLPCPRGPALRRRYQASPCFQDNF